MSNVNDWLILSYHNSYLFQPCIILFMLVSNVFCLTEEEKRYNACYSLFFFVISTDLIKKNNYCLRHLMLVEQQTINNDEKENFC